MANGRILCLYFMQLCALSIFMVVMGCVAVIVGIVQILWLPIALILKPFMRDKIKFLAPINWTIKSPKSPFLGTATFVTFAVCMFIVWLPCVIIAQIVWLPYALVMKPFKRDKVKIFAPMRRLPTFAMGWWA